MGTKEALPSLLLLMIMMMTITISIIIILQHHQYHHYVPWPTATTEQAFQEAS